MTRLLDPQATYLRIIYEMEERGVAPTRARIARQLGQSPPTVSQTVQRLHRAGLLELPSRGTALRMSTSGHAHAATMVRRLRLVESLFITQLHLDGRQAYAEAQRWYPVITQRAEDALVQLLDDPGITPCGFAIPPPTSTPT